MTSRPKTRKAPAARALSWAARIRACAASTQPVTRARGVDYLDMERPSVARIYDYYLGGQRSFAAHRRFAEQIIAMENRRFLRRAVQVALEAGVRQFLDLGSRIPTGNLHEIVAAHDPAGRWRRAPVRSIPVFLGFRPAIECVPAGERRIDTASAGGRPTKTAYALVIPRRSNPTE